MQMGHCSAVIMDTVNNIFSFLCSQNTLRSFVIGDHTLPFCQRCTGLYLGLALTFIYLLATRQYKKGLPTPTIGAVNIASVALMIVFGFHILDPGPQWRLWSGLLFGNAIAYLIGPATWQLHKGLPIQNNQQMSTKGFFALFAFLNTIPLWFPLNSQIFYLPVIALALLGLIAPLTCGLIAIGQLIQRIVRFSLLKGAINE